MLYRLSRIKESHDATGNNAERIIHELETTGPIITSAAIIVVLVATAFASADIIIIKALGLGTAIAIFIYATVVRTFLVPALMQIMGRWNWWAPSLLRRSMPQS